jgi:hypothetical protein
MPYGWSGINRMSFILRFCIFHFTYDLFSIIYTSINLNKGLLKYLKIFHLCHPTLRGKTATIYFAKSNNERKKSALTPLLLRMSLSYRRPITHVKRCHFSLQKNNTSKKFYLFSKGINRIPNIRLRERRNLLLMDNRAIYHQ